MNISILYRVFYAVIVITSFVLYPVLNKKASITHIIKLGIDDWIPFIPIFSVPYIVYIPFLVITLVYFIFFTRLFKAISISFVFCQFIAALFYIFYQTTVPRPEILNTDLFSKLVLYIYSNDKPFNCFPSLHVALSSLCFLYWIQIFPNLKWQIGAFVLSIILSTLFIKQHYTLDVLSGIVLAIVSFYVGKFFLNFTRTSF